MSATGRRVNPLYYLLAAVPVAVAAEVLHWPPLAIFGFSALAILPLSALLGHATEQLAGHAGPTVGGLLNATLGNLAELIIAALALRAGMIELVAASITGSILGNLLLVLGAAMLAGGLRYPVQKFNANLAGMSGSLLVIAVVGLVVPALFAAAHPDPQRVRTVRMSEWVSGLLIVGYALSLLYSMGTHRAAFTEGGDVARGEAPPEWGLRRTLLVLAAVAAVIGVLSEFLVGATEEASRALGLSDFFVGLVVVPIIGNAAEHSSAVLMALKDRMDLAVNIAIGSCVQVALLVAPILVFLGVAFGQPMTLAFSTFEVASVTLAVLIAMAVLQDAESNWLEGALLLVVYAVLAVAFFLY
ncbi:calcium/proton exchanger [Roseisolibacter sp. H3M3-2]|uniref:calcium/proton exchanger n=1 Tax=Roseisolibacter sp. H3M3-2 TaxID=3031323 RepID=UPI0023D9D371|nr:calcium/proton exchanger [Roseisolibacter sp. H3M3-2]MDF1503221.1 calcium/proton exchanger [Roseisolibacter sp. H3M3-2]